MGRLAGRLRESSRRESLHHRGVYRPWGFRQTVDAGNRLQAKRITVKPDAKLRLQLQHHRAEHWIVVCGAASVTRDGQTRLLRESESIYTPLGAHHRLENPGKLPLHPIEVQSGAYLGGGDIVRLEDSCGHR